MKKTLHVHVADTVATYQKRDGDIVCDNKHKYQVQFAFDDEWAAQSEKTARFIWGGQYHDVDFTGDTCDVPPITDADCVEVGVYAGDLTTTTPAVIGCNRSILSRSQTQRPESAEVYANEAKEAAERATEDARAEVARLVEEIGIAQTLGDSEEKAISQKTATKGFKHIISGIDTLLKDNLISRHITFTNESVSNSGETYKASTRLLSNFFEVTDNAKYNIALDATKNALVEYLFYDEGKNLITYTDWNPAFFKTKDGYKYVRLLVKNSTNTDINPADYEFNDWVKINLSEIYRRDIALGGLTWENKTINEANGTLSNAGTRCTSELIPIRKDDIIFTIYGKYDDLWYQVHYYHEDGSCSVANYYTHVDRRYPIPCDCVGIRLQFRKPDNTNMPSMADFKATVGAYTCYTVRDQAELKKATKHEITVAHQNIRVFNYSGGTKGCPNNEVNANLPKWKANISKWLNADVLNVDEWHNKFDQAGSIDAYTELLQQFYPYYYDTGNGKALFSKYPCTFDEIFIDQRLIVCNFVTEGEKIAVVGWISSNTYEPSRRITAYNAIIKYLGRYDKAVVLGDFNNDEGAAELQVFIDNGYTLGNNGYWGELDTCPSDHPFTAIDNIITKGFIFEDFAVGDDRVTSDHYPVKAKLAFFTI